MVIANEKDVHAIIMENPEVKKMNRPYHKVTDMLIDEQLSVRATIREMQFTNNIVNDPVIDFAESVHQGLNGSPRILPSKYLYDAKGTDLFEQICDLPEYYLTRTEEEILIGYSSEISKITGPITLIELGAGSSRKTKILLQSYSEQQQNLDYIAVDVSESALQLGKRNISGNFNNM